MSTETISSRYADLDLWTTQEAVSAMFEGQLAATAAVQPQLAAIARAADEAAERLGNPAGRLVYVGAGTSGRIAVQDGVELGPTFGWPGERVLFHLAGGTGALMSSVEGAEDDVAAGEQVMRDSAPTSADVVVGVAASGTTPYTVAAVRAGAEAGALTIGIASNRGTPLLRSVAHPILLETGAEAVAGSTRMKAGTAQKIALNLFSTAVMLRLGRVYRGLMVSMRVTNAKLRSRAIQMIGDISGVDREIADAAFDKADGEVKLAALIARGMTPEEGLALLAAAGGNLRTALAQAGGF